MQTITREVFQWLARGRVTMPTHSLTHHGQPLTGDALHAHVADFWKQVWPAPNFEAQQVRQQQSAHLNQAATPWSVNSESPDLPPLTPEAFRQTFHRMQENAVGPDQWSARELCPLPDTILSVAIRFFTRIEEGEAWPSLVSWKQVHCSNPTRRRGV